MPHTTIHATKHTKSPFLPPQFDPKLNDTDKSPMECQNKGLWHLGISDEACENAGGEWFRTPCLTLKETIDNRPSRFNLTHPIEGTCQDNLNKLETAVVSASTSDVNFPFEATWDGCHEFCRSLPDYSMQIGMMTQSNESEDNLSDCTCIYRNDKLPSRDAMPPYSKPSPPKFTLTNSDGMALGLRPNIACDTDEDLMIETQVADANNPSQQFQITQDGQVVSVRCPEKVLTNVLGSGGTSCTDGVGLQLKEYGWIPSALTSSPTVSPTARPTVSPTARPTPRPTVSPTARPTTRPTARPLTNSPTTKSPTKSPTTNSPTTKVRFDFDDIAYISESVCQYIFFQLFSLNIFNYALPVQVENRGSCSEDRQCQSGYCKGNGYSSKTCAAKVRFDFDDIAYISGSVCQYNKKFSMMLSPYSSTMEKLVLRIGNA